MSSGDTVVRLWDAPRDYANATLAEAAAHVEAIQVRLRRPIHALDAVLAASSVGCAPGC
jgi:hypothetical protein